MTTYTFKANPATQFANWGDPSSWFGGVVPNSPSADVVFPTVMGGTGIYASFVTIPGAQSYSVNSVSVSNNYLVIDGSLSVANDLALLAGGEIDMGGGSLSAGSFENGGVDIQGSGQVHVSGTMSNTAEVVGGGLTLTLAGLNNTGRLQTASGDLTVNVSSGGFTNLSGSTLTGGTYGAGYTGNTTSNTLFLNVGGLVATDAANIVLDGGGAIDCFDSNTSSYVSIQSSLHAIASGGTLSLANQTYNFGALTDDGALVLSNFATLNAPQLTINSDGQVSGTGAIVAPIANAGVITAGAVQTTAFGDNSPDSLQINGAVTGGGTLKIASQQFNFSRQRIHASLELNGPVSENVVFSDGTGTLTLDNPASFTGAITPAGAGDEIILPGVSLSSVIGYSYSGDSSGGTLTLQLSSSTIALKLSGDFDRGSFGLSAGPQPLSNSPPSLAITLTAPFMHGTGDFAVGGLADIAWQNGGGATFWVSNGSALTQVVSAGQMGSAWTEKGVGDFNGDGAADLLWTNNNGQVAIWEMNGANLQGCTVPAGQMGSAWQVAGIGDFNGDGKADILWVNGGSAAVWTMNGTTLDNCAVSNGMMGNAWHVGAIGDFNANGRSDVLWEDSTTGKVAIWEMNGANLSGFDANVGQMGLGWRIAGVGHFTGAADSTSDVVWVDGSNHVQIWQMVGGHIASIITPNGLDGAEWQLRGVGNFAGDANSDLLWMSNTGAVNVWELNGSNVTGILFNAPSGSGQQLAAGTQSKPAGEAGYAPPTQQPGMAPLIMSGPSQFTSAGAATDSGQTSHALMGR
jgi:hypothetical protein